MSNIIAHLSVVSRIIEKEIENCKCDVSHNLKSDVNVNYVYG